MKKILLIIISFLLFSQPVFAGDLNITCDNQSCETVPGGQAALFAEYEFPNYDIKPGDTISRKITVDNKSDEICNLYMLVKNPITLPEYSLDEVMDMVIKDGVREYFGSFSSTGYAEKDKTLLDLYGVGVLLLGSITSGQSNVYDWIITVDPKVGNEYQKSKTSFDFDLTFECGNPFSPTPTPSPIPSFGPTSTPTSTSTPSGDGGGGGTGGGTGTTQTQTANPLILGAQTVFARLTQNANDILEPFYPLPEIRGTEGEVKGESDQNCCPKVEPLWWIVLMLQVLVLMRYFMHRIIGGDTGNWPVYILAVTVLAVLAHWLGHPWFINRGYTESRFCDWAWLLYPVTSIILATVFRFVFREEYEK